MKAALKRACDNNELVKVKNSYKLSAAAKKAPPKKAVKEAKEKKASAEKKASPAKKSTKEKEKAKPKKVCTVEGRALQSQNCWVLVLLG